jgi:hypothetical protein
MNMSRLRLVGNPDDAAQGTSVPTVERSADGTVTILQTVYQQAPDDLLAFPFGFEVAAARSLVRRGKLRAARIGRRVYAKRSDVLALVDALSALEARPDPQTDTYADLVARSRSGKR